VTTFRLGDLAHGRDNNFQLIRLVAASFVVLFHSFALTGRWTQEPLWRVMPETNFGALGVKIFFVVSGFLVTRSWLSRRAVGPFVAARVLRIYPALVAATLLTILLAGISSSLAWPQFLADPQTIDYAWRVALGWEVVYRLPGAFPTNPFPHDVNGSLWTLPIELRLYVASAGAGFLGILARRGRRSSSSPCSCGIRVAPRMVSAVAQRQGGARARAPLSRSARSPACGARACRYRWPALRPRLALVAWNPAGLPRGRCSRRSSRTSCWSRLSPATAMARVQPRRRLFVRLVRLFVPAPADVDAAVCRRSSRPGSSRARCRSASRSRHCPGMRSKRLRSH
jgi:peptidoglycan/LPS O-acetylase OafA/YrhL